jgi:hypothetical protein
LFTLDCLDRLDREDRANVVLDELRVREVVDRDHAHLSARCDDRDQVTDRRKRTPGGAAEAGPRVGLD